MCVDKAFLASHSGSKANVKKTKGYFWAKGFADHWGYDSSKKINLGLQCDFATQMPVPTGSTP